MRSLMITLGLAMGVIAGSAGSVRAQADTARIGATRLVFSPTARTLPRNTGSVTFLQTLLPVVQFGLTDRLSLGAGTVALPFEPGHRPVLLTSKLQVYRGAATQAAVGVIHVRGGRDWSGGLAYAAVTLGTPNSAVTAGVGWSYSGSRGPEGRPVVVTIGGEHRLTRSASLVADALIFRHGGFVFSGFRLERGRFVADLGVERLSIAFPVVNIGWRF